MSVMNLLDMLEDLVENSSSIPFSGKVLLDREEIIELIKEIRIQLPDEIKQAQWIREERNKILVEAQKEAENIVEDAKEHIEELIKKENIIKLAQEKAEEIIEQSEKQAKEIKFASTQYADQLLEQLEKDITKVLNTLKENRQELKEYNRKNEN